MWSCAYDGVLRLATGEPVEIRVVRHVHEERAARVGLARVGHAQGPFGVGRLVDVLVLDVAAAAARPVAPVLRLMNVPSFGPPVPERPDLGSTENGQPNWFINPGMTRWK